MENDSILRFEPDSKAVQREQILIGVAVAILGPGLIYLSGEQNLVLLAVLAAVGWVAGYGIYALRNYVRAAQSIEVADDALIITKRRHQLRLPWQEIRDVTQRAHYGDFLAIKVTGKKQPHVVLLDGYTPDQISTIQTLIRQRKQTEADAQRSPGA